MKSNYHITPVTLVHIKWPWPIFKVTERSIIVKGHWSYLCNIFLYRQARDTKFMSYVHLLKSFFQIDLEWPWPLFQGHRWKRWEIVVAAITSVRSKLQSPNLLRLWVLLIACLGLLTSDLDLFSTRSKVTEEIFQKIVAFVLRC